MTKKFDYLVYIGRFEPVTIAHMSVMNLALGDLCDKLIVLVGSSGEPRTLKNPFTFEEREEMIRQLVSRDEEKLIVKPIYDYPYNDNKWVAGVQKTVQAITNGSENVGIIGYSKDSSSYYLTELFPMWRTVDVKPYQNQHGQVMSATDVRFAFYENRATYGMAGENELDVSDCIKLRTFEFMQDFFASEEGIQMRKEYEYIKDYKKTWGKPIHVTEDGLEIQPVFVTGDAVVVQNGHVLLIRRKGEPGKGLWALPGGFINPYERIRDGIIRELHEETMVKVPVEVLRRNIKHIHVFDNPGRSDRGRIITHAAHIDLGNFAKLPHVKGSDDADKARWVAFADVKREEMFEDHYAICDFYIGMA